MLWSDLLIADENSRYRSHVSTMSSLPYMESRNFNSSLIPSALSFDFSPICVTIFSLIRDGLPSLPFLLVASYRVTLCTTTFQGVTCIPPNSLHRSLKLEEVLCSPTFWTILSKVQLLHFLNYVSTSENLQTIATLSHSPSPEVRYVDFNQISWYCIILVLFLAKHAP